VDNRRSGSARRQSEPENEDHQMTDQPGENPTEPTPEGSATPPPASPPPPPASSTPPPAAPASGAPTGTSSGAGYQFDADRAKAAFQGAHKFDLGIIAAGVVALIGSWLPFYTISVSAAGIGSGSDSASAWHAFFGWFGVLVALAGSVVVALSLLNMVKLPMPVHQIAAGAFGLATLCLILALFVDPGGCGGAGAFGVHCDIGRGFGYWLALIAVLAGLGLSVMRMRESTTARTA
jgi:hypothetical protein